MKKILQAFLVCCLWLCLSHAKAQDYTPTSGLRISLITCSPGEELYALFGHTAIRVTDSVSKTDYVFNYGTFNFDDPNFYVKFARGKLLYYLSAEPYSSFLNAYLNEGRNVTEQVLQITEIEKWEIKEALYENIKEENRYYQYDFFFDNCTTRPRDLILKVLQPSPQLPAVMPENFTYRNAIHQYLDAGKQYWSKFGIDLLLGARTDNIMTKQEQMFLPENLMQSAELATNRKFIEDTRTIQSPYSTTAQESFWKPLNVFLLFALIVFVFTLLPTLKNSYITTVLHKTIFYLTGLIGILLVLMWFCTDHSMTKYNYNLLWAWPTHLLIPFFYDSKKKWINIYLYATTIITFLTFACWWILPQQMNISLLPWLTTIILSTIVKIKK